MQAAPAAPLAGQPLCVALHLRLPAVLWLGACHCQCAQRQQGLSSGWTWRRGCSRSVPICWGGPVTAALMPYPCCAAHRGRCCLVTPACHPMVQLRGSRLPVCRPAVQLKVQTAALPPFSAACRRRLLPCSTHCRNVRERSASACAFSESHLPVPDLACLALYPACLPDCWQADSCLCSPPPADNTFVPSWCVGSASRTQRLPRRLCARARRIVLVQCGRTTTQATRMRAWNPGCASSLLPRELSAKVFGGCNFPCCGPSQAQHPELF